MPIKPSPTMLEVLRVLVAADRAISVAEISRRGGQPLHGIAVVNTLSSLHRRGLAFPHKCASAGPANALWWYTPEGKAILDSHDAALPEATP